MVKKSNEYLSRRERQIMDVVYRRKKATVSDVCDDLDDIPNYTAARVLMHLLEDKGLLRHERQGQRYVYYPTVSPRKARKSELKHVMRTFFDGSPRELMADLIDISQKEMSEDEWSEIYRIIDDARKQGR
ncbi:MAG TPA: BlaI/MecI/CopY family transcriptional regulator [Acidobacteriota bacterium]|nr:BlaI/MecI/CopY family transcriptional regulator [Acidobacteriota bacterium]